MIPQAELDRALARWKARKSGGEAPTPVPVAHTPTPVRGVPQAVAHNPFEAEATYVAGATYSAHAVAEMQPETSSGVIALSDLDVDGDEPR
jgi:hypothetical protein